MRSVLRATGVIFAGTLAAPTSATTTWTPNGVPVSMAINNQDLIHMAPDGSGGALIVWRDERSDSLDIYAQRLSASGVPLWTANGLAVCSITGSQMVPRIVSDGTGGAVIVWADSRDVSTSDIYAQRINAAGAPVWTTDGVPVCTVAGKQSTPAILADGVGGAFIAWADEWSGELDQDIYAQRIDGSGALQWLPLDGLPVTTAPGKQATPVVVSDGGSGVIILWRDVNGHVYAQRVTGDGGILWGRGGTLVAPLTLSMSVTADGAGGAMVAYARVGGTVPFFHYDIRAQRIDGAGTHVWPSPIDVCTASGDQETPTISLAGTGEVIVAWQDARGGSTTDIYAQKINGAGAAQWVANGVAVCTAGNSQSLPSIVTDGAGGAIIAWDDERAGTSNIDIYAQQISTAGVPQWTTNGIVVCDATYHQRTTSIVAAGTGAAIIGWEDRRDEGVTQVDVYAERVPVGLPTPVGDPVHLQGLQIRENAPNPFTNETRWQIGVARDSNVRIDVFDVAGRRIRRIELSARPGWQEFVFDGRDASGQHLPSGVYFCRISADGETLTRKMTLVR